MSAVGDLAGHVGVRAACKALRVAHSTYYRRRRPKKTGQRQPRPTPARALSEAERTEVFEVLCSSRFADRAPAEVYATLLDEGVYLCSERTMYRILAENRAVRERRAQRSHPNHPKPEVVARGPNEAWSWDVTRLLGPRKGQYFYLYVILDIFSRYVTRWMVAERETAGLAGRLIEASCLKHGVLPQVLTLHSDRRSPMTAKCTGATAGRPGRHAIAEPSPGLERQSLLGGAVQDRQIPPRLPRPVLQHRGGEGVLPVVLPVVQHRAPAWRHRPADPRPGPLRPCPRGDPPEAGRSRRRLRRPSGALRGRPATPRTGLDQPPTPRQRS